MGTKDITIYNKTTLNTISTTYTWKHEQNGQKMGLFLIT
jgi:hypothetical protein